LTWKIIKVAAELFGKYQNRPKITVFNQPFIYFVDTYYSPVTVDLYSVNPVVHYGVQNGLRWHPPQGVRGNKGNLTIVTLSRGWSRPFAGLDPLSDDVSMKKP
jgi:hypothetical protein